MRILWLSRGPWETGGYSNQTALFVPRLAAAGHELAIVGIHGIANGMLDWRRMPVYPLLSNDLRSTTVLGLHYQDWRADLMISLHDIERVVDGPALIRRFPTLLWALWAPIHRTPLSAAEEDQLRAVSFPIVMSRFGEAVAREPGLLVRYIPHGVDTRIFHPRDRVEARALLGWPADAFIAGMVAANNGTRKAFPQHIEGFARFHRDVPHSLLYLHTLEAAAEGLDLSSICMDAGLKVGKEVLFCDPYRYYLGIRDAQMALRFCAMDVLLMATKGEGFGLPILEAQACGTPVIVGDWSAMPELCFAGWKVAKEESRPLENHWRLASPEAIAHRLEQAYLATRDPDRRASLSLEARRGTLRYDADRVTEEFWLPFLDGIRRSAADEEHAMSPVGPRSAGRREGTRGG